MIYNKLVRDKIPQIIESNGEKAITRILGNEEYIQELERKIQEEVDELLRDKNIEEMADVLEVLQSLAKARGLSWNEVEKVMYEKREKRGGFDEKIFLIETN